MACDPRPGGEFQSAPEYSIEMLDVIDRLIGMLELAQALGDFAALT